jgi:hypothetical protein
MARPQRFAGTLAPLAFAWITLLAAAGVAALVAHVAIDIAANFFVAHDPYDDIEHHSRFWFLGGSLAIAGAGALAVLAAALKDFHLGEFALRGLIGRAASTSPVRFVASVIPLTFVALLAMESFDSYANNGRACSTTDALGGSLVLGSIIIIATAIASALAVWRLLRYLAQTHRAIVQAIGSFLVGARETSTSSALTIRILETAGPATSVLARRAGKRAPPLFA